MSFVNQPFLEDDDSSDDISVTSTVEGDNDITYPLDRVVAEQQVEEDDLENGNVIRKTYYLVKWQGYSEEENTWEPEDKFDEGLEQTMLDWGSYKMRLARGLQVDWQFDLDAWQERQNQREEEKDLRHERRRQKRIKLGMPVSASLEEERRESEITSVKGTDSNDSLKDGVPHEPGNHKVAEESSDSDAPLSRKRPKMQQFDRDAKRRSLDIKATKGKAVPINKRQTTRVPVRKVQPTPTSFFDTIGRPSVVASKTPLRPLDIPLRPSGSSMVSPQIRTAPLASMAQRLRPSKAPRKLMINKGMPLTCRSTVHFSAPCRTALSISDSFRRSFTSDHVNYIIVVAGIYFSNLPVSVATSFIKSAFGCKFGDLLMFYSER